MFTPKHGLELTPVLRRLIGYGEVKPIAAQLGVSYEWLGRVIAGQTSLPASMLAPLAALLPEAKRAELLHAVLGTLAVTISPAPPADPEAARLSGLATATRLDCYVERFEQLAVAVEQGCEVPERDIDYAGSRVASLMRGWRDAVIASSRRFATVKVAA